MQRSSITAYLFGALTLAVGCSKHHDSDSNDVPVAPISGEPQLISLFSGMQLGSGPPSVGFIAPDGDEGVALRPPIVMVFSESMDGSTVNATSVKLTSAASNNGGGGGFPGGGGGFPGIGFLFGPDRDPGGTDGTDNGGTDGTGVDTDGDGIPDDFNGDGVPDAGVETPVLGSVVADPDTKQRVYLFLPAADLAKQSQHTLTLATSITDLEGVPLEKEPTEDDSGTTDDTIAVTAGFTTRGDNDPDTFRLIAMYPRPGDQNIPVDSCVKLYFNDTVSTGSRNDATSSLKVLVGTQNWPGEFKIDRNAPAGFGVFSVRYKPTTPFPQGATVKVIAKSSYKDAEGDKLNGGSEDFEATFRVSSVPTPTAIAFPDNLPTTVDGVPFDGSVSSENFEKFLTDVSLDKGGAVDSVTLLFFQSTGSLLGGATGSIARAFTVNQSGTVVRFSPSLKQSGSKSVFAESDETFPPQHVLVGAFATKSGQNSPVGPVTLPRLFVETSKPKVEFGPPSPDGDPLTLATTLSKPVFYGSASEPLKSLRIVVGAQSIPITFQAVPLDGTESVTGNDDVFITDAGQSVLPGADDLSGPRFLPLEISEIEAEDQFGNVTEKRVPKAGTLWQQGSIGGSLESGAALSVRVRVVNASTLKPLDGATVQACAFPYDPLGPPPLVKHAKSDGEATFLASDLAVFGPRFSITVTDQACDVFSMLGLPAPTVSGYGVSIPLERSLADPVATIDVSTSLNVFTHPGNPVPPFLTAAANAAAPKAGTGSLAGLSDRRFSFGPVQSSTHLLLELRAQRPTVVSAMEHDGEGRYFFDSSNLLVPKGGATFTPSYQQAGTTAQPQAGSFANTVVAKSEVSGAGITADPLLVTRGRLVGKLPGLEGVFPLSIAPPFDVSGNPALRVVFAPIPESLWENEASQDPIHELLMQPTAAIAGAAPSETLLEETYRLEIEAQETVAGFVQRTLQRAKLDFTTHAGATTIEAIDLPQIPVFAVTPNEHPPHLTAIVHDVSVSDSMVSLAVSKENSGRRWKLWVDAQAVADVGNDLRLPPSPVKPFSEGGNYRISMEAIEFESGTFDFSRFVFSDVERELRRAALSLPFLQDTTPP